MRERCESQPHHTATTRCRAASASGAARTTTTATSACSPRTSATSSSPPKPRSGRSSSSTTAPTPRRVSWTVSRARSPAAELSTVLRNGVRDSGCKFRLAYFQPASGLNEELKRLHGANIFSVVRQLHFSESEARKTDRRPRSRSSSASQSVDLGLFLNGVPIFTAELKNPLTGQNVDDAILQYRNDRDPREPLFAHRRCLAHFAVDPNWVYVTTQLRGPKTRFLPFNRGKFGGAGNPPVPPTRRGYATDYLWDEVWARVHGPRNGRLFERLGIAWVSTVEAMVSGLLYDAPVPFPKRLMTFRQSRSRLISINIPGGAPTIGTPVQEITLPADAAVAVVVREDVYGVGVSTSSSMTLTSPPPKVSGKVVRLCTVWCGGERVTQ